jgi:hypothetical protein
MNQDNSNTNSSVSNSLDTGIGNTNKGNGNNFVGDSEGETGSENQADGNGNWYFGNNNQTNGNGNWYISQESDLPDNFLGEENNSFIENLFGDNGNSIGGNIPAFAGDGVPSFFNSNDFSTITGGDRNQTNGNGNWEFGDGNQTEGNANWNLGDGNTITGNGNQPSGDNNQVTGNGNQPSGDNNQINGNRLSPEEGEQNIVGNGDRYLIMDSEGNIFVVNDESASDSQSEFDFEFLTNANGDESETASLDQPFVQNLFSQFASGNNFSTDNATEETTVSENQSSFTGNISSNVDNNSDNNNNTEDQDSDLDEQLRQSPFGRLLDLPGVDGAEDIFGNLGAPSGGDSEGGIGTSNPFANWDPVTEGNPFTPDDDTPENENLSGGETQSEGGGQNNPNGESISSPWDALLQFEEFESVEDILGISTGNNSSGGEPSDDESNESTWDGTLQFDEFETNTEAATFDSADSINEEFADTPIADLLDFPEVDSPEDIFSTFGIGDDANSENLLEDWNPFTDGNPFVVGDEEETEPVYNTDGDRLLVENQFGYMIQNSEDILFLSLDETINENDIEISQGGFSDDLFDSDSFDNSSTNNNFSEENSLIFSGDWV